MGHLVRLSYPEAPSGSWAITPHLSGDSAVAYSDYDCTVVDMDRALNASGRKAFYINAVVDIVVQNANGVQVDAFTEGTRAELVGVNSPAWTGTLPNGTQGRGGYLPLQSLLSNMASSFGSTDGYVKETGQSTALLLKDSLAAIRSANFPYFNVRSAPYNAFGDNTHDDTAACQAAINAAVAAGGGIVFFPIGTYKITSPLTITSPLVSLVGAGARHAALSFSIKWAVVVNCVTSNTCANFIDSLGFIHVVDGAGAIQVLGTPFFQISNCRVSGGTFGGDNPATFDLSGSVVVKDNLIEVTTTGSSSAGVIDWHCAGSGLFSGNIGFTSLVSPFISASYPGFLSGGAGVFVGNASNGGILIDNTGAYVCTGNYVGAGISIGTNAVTSQVSETGTSIGSNLLSTNSPLSLPVGGMTTGTVTSTSREFSVDHGSGTTFSPKIWATDQFIDASGNLTINAPTSPDGNATKTYNGAPLQFRIRNTTGGAITVAWNAVYLAPPTGNIAAGQTRVVRFVRKHTGTSPGWRYAGHFDTT